MHLKDAHGKPSRTLLFVTSAFLVLMFKFICAGLELPVIGLVPHMTVSEFAIGYTAIMAVWQGREWRETHYQSRGSDGPA